MRIPSILTAIFVWLAASHAAFARDQHFYDVARNCRANVEVHPFSIRFSIDTHSTFAFVEDTPFTQCLAQGAASKDDDGSQRRLSLEASLDGAVNQCREKFGSIGDFTVVFIPESQGYFSVRTGPQANKTRACIAMLTGTIQPFGAQK